LAIISEHEAVVSSFEGVNPNQPEADKDVIKMVNELMTRAKRHRRQFDTDWRYNYEFVIGGKQWPVERPRWRFNEVVNITWASIMTEVAIQTDARPKFEFTSQEFSDDAFTKVLKEVVANLWDKYSWNQMVSDELIDGKIYHVAHAQVGWDEDLEQGLGDICIKVLDPFYCYWDPRASDINYGTRKCRYFIYAEPVPTAELRHEYPEQKEKIKEDIANMRMRSDQTVFHRSALNYDPYSPSRLPSSGDSAPNDEGGEPLTLKICCWLRDDTLEELVNEDEFGKKEYVLKKKYPTGRYIEIANAVILRDGPPGYKKKGEWIPYDHDLFPIAKLVNYGYPREYAGENEVTHMKGPNKIVNYTWSYILDCFRMNANPRIIVSSQSGIDVETLTNEPGLVVETQDMNGYRQEPGLAIAPQSFEILNQGFGIADRIQGLQDASRGANQPGATSAVLFEGYVEASQTRPRYKNRFLEKFLHDIGDLVLRKILQCYTEPRVFRLTNADGYPQAIELYIPTYENGQKVAKIRYLRTDGSGALDIEESHDVVIKGVPDVRVTSGSALPFAKVQKSQTAFQYFDRGAIDQEELLKNVDWPAYQEVIKRMQAQAAQAKEQGMQAEAAKAAK